VMSPVLGTAVRRVLLVTSAACILLVPACSSSSEAESPSTPLPASAYEVNLPSRLLGLKVVSENIRSNLSQIQQSYLQGLGLFSFREGNDLLRATLQVGRFNDVADQKKTKFQSAIIGQLGSSVPIRLRVGDSSVYLATGSDQNIFSWFDDRGFYVLSIRSDYPFPRTMMRKLLNMELLT
jgi:hypothetical protein